jgi:hypothetical protein
MTEAVDLLLATEPPSQGAGASVRQGGDTLASQSGKRVRLKRVNDKGRSVRVSSPRAAPRWWDGAGCWLPVKPFPGQTPIDLLRAALDLAHRPNAHRRCTSQTV